MLEEGIAVGDLPGDVTARLPQSSGRRRLAALRFSSGVDQLPNERAVKCCHDRAVQQSKDYPGPKATLLLARVFVGRAHEVTDLFLAGAMPRASCLTTSGAAQALYPSPL
jgi:hypothetical protein